MQKLEVAHLRECLKIATEALEQWEGKEESREQYHWPSGEIR